MAERDYRIDCSKSLHLLKDEFTKTHMAGQCRQLAAGLDSAIRATAAVAPVRTRDTYILPRTERTPTDKEARWEHALWREMTTPDSAAVPGGWYRILTYQVPLKETHDDQGWGKIDLLAVSHQGLPVVLELKQEGADDVPAKLLVQAAAYALALQKAWRAGVLASQWTRAIAPYGFKLELSPELGVVPLVCLAPAGYWANWIGNTARARRVHEGAWHALMELVAAFAVRGFPASFVELENAAVDDRGMPTAITARTLDPFVP